MKMLGMLIKDVAYCDFDDDASVEAWQDRVNAVMETLDSLGLGGTYSSGQDDATTFFASDNGQVLAELQRAFPGEQLTEVTMEAFPWDLLHVKLDTGEGPY